MDRVLGSSEVDALTKRHGREVVRDAARSALAEARSSIQQNGEPPAITARIAELVTGRLRASLRPVLNATGVVLHTNLGRAPLAAEVARHAASVAASYSTLELDLATGERGSRQSHVASLVASLSGAEDALVVNNCAAAVLLVATALAAGRDVIVSRGELVEIGGKFRVPDVLASCGARLVEVGTTNRTRRDDYARALGSSTAMLLKVHRSNFALVGFTEETSVAELVALAAATSGSLSGPTGEARGEGSPQPDVSRPVVVYDVGSGAMGDGRVAGVAEPTVEQAIRDGADLVTFSGDKLLGGPQAGIIVGRRALIERLRAHPLVRALRPGKLELAALEATLAMWRDGRADELPTRRALSLTVEQLREASLRLRDSIARLVPAIEVASIETEGRVGGGASPLVSLRGHAVALRAEASVVERLATELRRGDPPVIARVHEGALVIDPRTLLATVRAPAPGSTGTSEVHVGTPETDVELLDLVARLVAGAASRALC
ncbi:MAG: L-seryl-tRNA(Sec) selenium transferase [Deltaproteobacteria bacterium]|nr:L-seryl-tRNA(Sec) selenium transferase [Deltaproteobacteria bacterium]